MDRNGFFNITRIGADFVSTWKLAFRSFLSHPLRNMLTMLGVALGIAAVSVTIGMSQGAKIKVLSDIEKMGKDLLILYSGKGWGDHLNPNRKIFTDDDINLISEVSNVEYISPVINYSQTINYKNKSIDTLIEGVDHRYFDLKEILLAAGRFFTEIDVANKSSVIVIDQKIKNKLFEDEENFLGEVLVLGNMPLKIIGVASPKGINDDRVIAWMPYTTISSRGVSKAIKEVVVMLSNSDNKLENIEAIRGALSFSQTPGDFFFHFQNNFGEAIKEITETLTFLIIGVASVSLLIVGTAVMNMMLVAVNERTAEIGIRMAVGATPSNIMLQFIVESIIICFIGGFLGVAATFLIDFLAPVVIADIPMKITPSSVLLALLISSIVGILSGLIPAIKASKLTPIEALSRD